MKPVSELFKSLSGDPKRVTLGFSEDILQANALLHNTAATEEERARCLLLWCQHKQPCQFGKVAGKQGRIHFCFLSESAVSEWSDEEIAAKISEEKRLWKQRAAFDSLRAAHSFVIVVTSPRVALAAPDSHLRAFSDRVLQLTGWDSDRREIRLVNTVTSDFLYLKNPNDGHFYGFRFNGDFFACAADRRWWADHRFPGGIAFTANSTGHIMRFRQWYEGKERSEDWALKQAMLTIQNAEPTISTESLDPVEQGRATWLRPLDAGGLPLVQSVRCPLDRVPPVLEGKDWTRYEGVLHTDHAVREEFFLDREVAPTSGKPYLMDFTYLYDRNEPDFEVFSSGKLFSEDEVYAEIGTPRNWTHRTAQVERARSEDEAASVAEQLLACEQWEPPAQDRETLDILVHEADS